MLFNPLQMLAPFTVRARMAMQETWLLGLGWDDELPSKLGRRRVKNSSVSYLNFLESKFQGAIVLLRKLLQTPLSILW